MNVFAFSVSFRDRVNPLGSFALSSCQYLALRAEFTVPPRVENPVQFTNLRVSQQQAAPEIELSSGWTRTNSQLSVELTDDDKEVLKWRNLSLFFRPSVFA